MLQNVLPTAPINSHTSDYVLALHSNWVSRGFHHVGVMAVNGPIYGNSYFMTIKTSDTLAPGAYVYAYPTGGVGYVSATAAATSTQPIGVYIGHTTVTSAAAGTQIECLIGARFPNDTLKF